MKERHVTAKTSVEVYRLFKVQDAARAVREHTDPVVRALGAQMFGEAVEMLRNYVAEQNSVQVVEKSYVNVVNRKVKR